MKHGPDIQLPDDWPRARLLRLAAMGQLCFLAIALRHRLLWGGGFAWLLHFLEGAGLCLGTLLSGLALARCVRQASALDLRFLLRAGVVLTILATLAPPFLSDDVFDYLARGRVNWLGHDPYTTTVGSLASDPRMAEFAALSKWNGWVMPYGPVSALLQLLLSGIPAPWVGAYLWKLLMAGAHVATAWFVFDTLRTIGDERDARRGFVLWLWNPWLLLESCGAGHNDALQALLLAMMCAAVARARIAHATAGYGYSLLVKHGSAPIGPLLLAHAIWTRKGKQFALGVGATLLAVLVAWFVWFREPGALAFLAKQASVDRASVSAFVAMVFGEATRRPVQVLGLIATLLVLAQGFLRAKDATAFGRWAILAMALFVLVAVPNFAPWYHYWWLPLFALGQLPVLARVIELLAWVGPFSYLIWAMFRSLGAVHQTWQFLLAGLWPFLLLLLDWRSLTSMKKRSVASDPDPVADAAHKH